MKIEIKTLNKTSKKYLTGKNHINTSETYN